MVQDNFIKSFEMKDVHHCNDEKSGVYSLCKLDNNNFISGGADGNIKFWENINKNEYKCIQEFGEHKDKVRNLVLLKDDYLCSASDDGFVKENQVLEVSLHDQIEISVPQNSMVILSSKEL